MALNALQIHHVAKGDRQTPLAVALKQSNSAVNLTGKTVQFKMVKASDASEIVAWTATNVTVTGAAAGEAQYDFAEADVDEAGVFYGWFRSGDGTEWDTFPVDGRKLQILITDPA